MDRYELLRDLHETEAARERALERRARATTRGRFAKWYADKSLARTDRRLTSIHADLKGSDSRKSPSSDREAADAFSGLLATSSMHAGSTIHMRPNLEDGRVPADQAPPAETLE